uniref:Uncharacterized protein n=1 Tax=Panagrolaimus sp. PS1159 TaxID=55785 RepID=A0AC35FS98_9BILA
MSSSPNAEEGSGSPPLSGNGNGKAAAAGALPSSSNVAPNSNGNGHGYPRSGMDSPTNVFRIEQQNKLLLKLMNIEPGQADMAPKFAKGSLLDGEREINIITNVYGLNQTGSLAVHTYHLLLARIRDDGLQIVIDEKLKTAGKTMSLKRKFHELRRLFRHQCHVARITQRGTYPVIKSKRRSPDHAIVMRRQFYQKVYVANCYAERGRQIANNFRLTKLSPEQQKAGLAMSAENEKDDTKSEYYLKSLQYNYSCRPQLRSRRVNA